MSEIDCFLPKSEDDPSRPPLIVIDGGLGNTGAPVSKLLPVFEGIDFSGIHLCRESVSFSKTSAEVLVLKGIKVSCIQEALGIYEQRQELRQTIEDDAQTYIQFRSKQDVGLPSISDIVDPEADFWGKQYPEAVMPAIDLGLIIEKPNPEDFWAVKKETVFSVAQERVKNLNLSEVAMQAMIVYLVTIGHGYFQKPFNPDVA